MDEFLSSSMMRRIIWDVVLVIIIAIPAIIRFQKNRKSNKGKKILTANNQYLLNNRETLSKIVDDNSGFRKHYTNILLVLGIIFLGLLIVMLFYSNFNLEIIIPYFFVMVIILIMATVVLSIRYESRFKEEVVKKIITHYNPNFEYSPFKGISAIEYRSCQFGERYDNFQSEDLITDQSNSFLFSDIKLIVEHHDSDGGSRSETVYQGSLARIDIRDCGCRIFLGNVRKNFLFNDDKNISIKLENDEFNKLFSTYTDNELLAYKVLTPDIVEQLIMLKKNSFGDIDIRLLHDKLYVRFYSGDGFNPSLINKTKEKDNIIMSIAVLESVIETMNNIKEMLEKKYF